MNRFIIKVERVQGYCSCGYNPGDTFYSEGLNTTDKPICGGAYTILFPIQTALVSGDFFAFENNQKERQI